jgi:hypothetical protein
MSQWKGTRHVDVTTIVIFRRSCAVTLVHDSTGIGGGISILILTAVDVAVGVSVTNILSPLCSNDQRSTIIILLLLRLALFTV